ncbi:MAG: hypothetical protein M1836_003803 [Candelina mexicana]|nr:MAG: hypothetical protein M1836_003803 [Candelina mexicana]
MFAFSFISLLFTIVIAPVTLFPTPTHADCRPGLDDCTLTPLVEKDNYSSATTYQCHYASWPQAMYHTRASDCTLAAGVACALLASDSPRGMWQNATAGNCWVGAYMPSRVAGPYPNASTISLCTDQVFAPMIKTCISNPDDLQRVDSAFFNVVVPPYGDVSYSWFVDYTKAAFIVTTKALVAAGQVPGINSTGQVGPYGTGPDPAGKPQPAGCSQRGGYCPTGSGSVSEFE